MRDVLLVAELVQLGLDQALAAQHVRLEPPWEVLAGLVLHVRARRDGKDVIEFLEGALLGFRKPEEAGKVSSRSCRWGMTTYIMTKASAFMAA